MYSISPTLVAIRMLMYARQVPPDKADTNERKALSLRWMSSVVLQEWLPTLQEDDVHIIARTGES